MTQEINIDKLAKESFFRQSDMIQFLIAENLALKMLLLDKKLLTPEEFNDYKSRAEGILKSKMDKYIEDWKANHPQVVDLVKKANSGELASATN